MMWRDYLFELTRDEMGDPLPEIILPLPLLSLDNATKNCFLNAYFCDFSVKRSEDSPQIVYLLSSAYYNTISEIRLCPITEMKTVIIPTLEKTVTFSELEDHNLEFVSRRILLDAKKKTFARLYRVYLQFLMGDKYLPDDNEPKLTAGNGTGMAEGDSAHYHYDKEKRFEIAQDYLGNYREAKRLGEVGSKDEWADKNYRITAKTLDNYVREYQKQK